MFITLRKMSWIICDTADTLHRSYELGVSTKSIEDIKSFSPNYVAAYLRTLDLND